MASNLILIGESCIDRIINCVHERNSPEDNIVPVLKVLSESDNVGMLQIVRNHLHLFGNNEYGIFTNNPDKIIKTRVFKNDKQVIRIDNDSKVSLDNIDDLKYGINQDSSIVVSDYGKGLLSKEIINIICSSNKRIYLDPHPNNDINQYRNLFAIKLNNEELQTFTGLSDLKKGSQLLKGMTSAKHIFVTLGKNGIYYYNENTSHYFPSQVKEVVNVSGAGDVVMASIVSDMEKELSIDIVLENAMKRAAEYVQC